MIDIARITYGSADLIVGLLPNSFDQKTSEEKNVILVAIQNAARSAGIVGRLIAIWEDGMGERKTLAAPDLSALCYILSIRWVKKNLNARLEVEA